MFWLFKKCQILGKLLYKNVVNQVVLASSLKVAETTKMIENIFRSINIALVNELKMFLNKVDIDIDEALAPLRQSHLALQDLILVLVMVDIVFL